MRVVIAGGGLIGLCSAHALLRAGHEVTIIEPDHLGAGAATGNAGELTPQQVAPLASPATARDITRGLFTRSHYLSIALPKLPVLARFGLGFLASSRPKPLSRGTAALAQFANEILPALHRMREAGVDTGGGGTGYLMTSSNQQILRTAHAGYTTRAAREWGEAPGEILTQGELRELEPAIHPNVQGGFVLPGEFWLDPPIFVQSLITQVLALGAAVVHGAAVKILPNAAGFTVVNAAGETTEISGDAAVLAAGAWSSGVLRRSRIRAASVASGKGYSFTVPVERLPQHLLHAMDLHCVAIPMSGRLRIVGMMEFDGKPRSFRKDRIATLTSFARELVDGADWENLTDEWMGPRPMTSDGLPLLGELPGRDKVFVATGHNMHGLSLGPVTGEIIAQLVNGNLPTLGKKPLDMRPFRVRR